jgi:hypothetical protein
MSEARSTRVTLSGSRLQRVLILLNLNLAEELCLPSHLRMLSRLITSIVPAPTWVAER